MLVEKFLLLSVLSYSNISNSKLSFYRKDIYLISVAINKIPMWDYKKENIILMLRLSELF